jgi:chlorophyll synthase
LLDQISADRPLDVPRFLLLHAPLSYLAIGWSLVLILAALSGWSRDKAARLIAVGLPVILLVPLIDQVNSAQPASHAGYFALAANFGLTHLIRSAVLMMPQPDVTLGQQLVVQLTSLTMGLLVLYARRSLALALASWALAICVLYMYGSLAAAVLRQSDWLTTAAAALAGAADTTKPALYGILLDFDAAMSAAYLLLVLLHAAIGAACWRAGIESQMLRNLRALRLLHYLLMFAIGLALSLASPQAVSLVLGATTNMLGIALAAAMIVSLFIAAVWLNDLCDRDIDQTSNPDRPFASGRISTTHLVILIALTGIYAIAAAATLGGPSMAILMVLAMLSFAYSVPPIRLRTHLGIAHAVIGVISATVMLYPYILLGTQEKFRPDAAWFVTIAMAIALLSTAKDLKDALGDARNGVRTLVTVFPGSTGKWLTALCSAIGALLLGYTVFGFHVILSLACAGSLISTYIMLRMPRGDRLLLALHLLWMMNVLVVATLLCRA